jgi:outer membrane protein OmpA-like peptidoglycan-associated protein
MWEPMTLVRIVSERGIQRLLGATLASALGCAALFAPARLAFAEEKPTQQDILDALRAPHVTRCPSSITGCGARTEDSEARKPWIDVEIYFPSGSAVPDASARAALAALSEALGKPRMKNPVLSIAGHTDARGEADYNQSLSERRADAVKRLLVEAYKLPADTFVTVGYGKQRLKNVADPFAGENRRVEIVDMEK